MLCSPTYSSNADSFHQRPQEFFLGGSEVHKGRACKGGRRVVGSRGGAPGRRRSFQNICKNINEKFAIFKKVSREFLGFSIFFKFYRIFGENLDKIQKIQKYAFGGGSEGGSPRSLANLWKSEQKNQWKRDFWIVLMKILPFFQFLRILSNFSRKLSQ